MNGLALAEKHRVQQVQLSAAATNLLAAIWQRTIDPNNVDATFPAFLAAAEVVLGRGRTASAELARLYYADVAALAGYAPVLLETPAMDLARVQTSLEVVGPSTVKAATARGMSLAEAERRGLASTIAAGKRIVLESGRELLVEASRRDAAVKKWARVSDGNPCGFCAMLIGRGAVYTERGSSKSHRSKSAERHGVAFRAHDRCGCGVRLVYAEDDDGGWSPQAEKYDRLMSATGWNPKEFSAALRLMNGQTKRSNLLDESTLALVMNLMKEG